LAHATETCDDKDEQSLLQSRMQDKHARQQNLDPALLLTSVKDMAHQMSKTGSEQTRKQIGDSPVEVNVAINSIRAALEMMTPLLEEEHARAQSEIQRQVEEIQACHNSGSHGTAVRDDLAVQLSTMNMCMEDEATAAETQQRECNE